MLEYGYAKMVTALHGRRRNRRFSTKQNVTDFIIFHPISCHIFCLLSCHTIYKPHGGTHSIIPPKRTFPPGAVLKRPAGFSSIVLPLFCLFFFHSLSLLCLTVPPLLFCFTFLRRAFPFSFFPFVLSWVRLSLDHGRILEGSINQSMNQPSDGSIKQSMNQAINQASRLHIALGLLE